MADSILRDKAKEFSKEIVFDCRDMKKDKKEIPYDILHKIA